MQPNDWPASKNTYLERPAGGLFVVDPDSFPSTRERIAGPAVADVPRRRPVLSFLAGAFVQASGGNFSMVQLFNPATSAHVLRLERLLVGHGTLGLITLNQASVALGTLVRRGRVNAYPSASSYGEIRSDQVAALVGTEFASAVNIASGPLELIRQGTLLVFPGTGLIVATDTVNHAMQANFEWDELLEADVFTEQARRP